MITSYDFFIKMPGSWAFSRILDNSYEPKLSGVVTGLAKFATLHGNPNQIHYSEGGRFITAGGYKLQIHNEYFFVFNIETGNIEKHFAQNGIKTGLFYILDSNFTGEHLCIEDTYKASYEFLSDDCKEFTLTYKVHGPKKSYSSITKYVLT